MLKIKKNRILWSYMLLPYLMPEFVYMNPITSRIVSLLKILNALIAVVMLLEKKKKKINYALIWLIIGQLLIVISGLRFDVFSFNSLLTIGICLIFHYGISYDTDAFLDSLLGICELLIIVNFVTMIVFPNGLYIKHTAYQIGSYNLNWVLGYKNTIVRFILPALLFELLDYLHKKENVKRISLGKTCFKGTIIIISVITLFISSSSNGVMGGIVFLGMCFLTYLHKLPKIITPISTFLICALASVGTLFMNLQSHFSYIIENLLNRNVQTMGGRNVLWVKALQLIEQRFYMGWGDYSSVLMNTVNASHPHNFYLYIFIRSGLLGMISFTLFMFVLSKELKKNRNSVFYGLITACLASFFVMGITESLTGTNLLYPVLLIGMYKKQICQS